MHFSSKAQKTFLGPRHIFILAGLVSLLAGDKQMVITVDDLPVALGHTHSLTEQQEITAKLVHTLQQFQVPAIGFVNENKLEDGGQLNPQKVNLLRVWLDAEMELGNHGYAHLDLHSVDDSRWIDDIALGDRRLRPLLSDYGKRPRYFRYPFLHTGRSLEIRQRCLNALTHQGYQVAPVTIDNQEWLFGRAYIECDSIELKERVGIAYISYMLDMLTYYEEQARRIVGERFPQILLIHAYELNADYLNELLGAIVARGYQFISLKQALRHPAYATADSYTGPAGITWLHRWAITKKMPSSTFDVEPDVPDWVKQYH